MASECAAQGRVVVVGLGDDGPSGLGVHARQAIREAELLIGGRRHLAWFPEHPAERLPITSNIEEVLEVLAARAATSRCVVLASGDPCYFGIGPLIAARLGRERVEIIPQPSSVALAFARLGLAWHDATVLSAHGRPLADLLDAAVRAHKLAILTDDRNTPAAIAEALLTAGRPDGPAFVLEHLGGAAERVVETRLSALPGQEFARLSVLVLLREDAGEAAPPPSLVELGRPESSYVHARGQITKAEVRAVTLAKLRLPAEGVLWDVGAGSGSLAIEAAGLMSDGTVFAIERDPEQLDCLRENLRRHGAHRVRIVEGSAPAVLDPLPRPDRIFLGGGGADLPAILAGCLARLGRQGRLVVNAATFESVADTHRACRLAGWQTELVQVAVARGRLVGGRTRLEALNPVFILTAWPHAESTAPVEP